MTSLIDISPLISENIAVWPGDTAFQRQKLMALADGHHLDLSGFSSTVHLGAHADAPSHYRANAQSIDAVPLHAYLGPCRVITIDKPQGGLIEAADIVRQGGLGVPRLLVRTNSFPDPNLFSTNFAAFASAAIDLLGEQGVVLVGIDTPSVDPYSSKDLAAHQALHRWSMANLEGLLLAQVQDGDYELIALPLRLKGFDASPVRAVLRR